MPWGVTLFPGKSQIFEFAWPSGSSKSGLEAPRHRQTTSMILRTLTPALGGYPIPWEVPDLEFNPPPGKAKGLSKGSKTRADIAQIDSCPGGLPYSLESPRFFVLRSPRATTRASKSHSDYRCRRSPRAPMTRQRPACNRLLECLSDFNVAKTAPK